MQAYCRPRLPLFHFYLLPNTGTFPYPLHFCTIYLHSHTAYPVLDRATPPTPAPLTYRPFPVVERATLPNGLDVYLVPNAALPLAEVQLVFRAGLVYEPQPGVGAMTLKMLREGTRQRNAAGLADALDSHGAFLGLDPGFEVSSIALSGLADRLPGALSLLHEVITQPAFDPHEFNLLRQRNLQSLAVEEQRTSYQARKRFMGGLFGAHNPYGRTVDAAAIQALDVEALQDFHRVYLSPGNAFIIVAGQYDTDAMLARLGQLFGTVPVAEQQPRTVGLDAPHTPETGRHFIDMPGRPQSTLRVGFPVPNRQHPDFHLARFATLILGGYFGSRLMRNLREEKGYTYGASASWGAYRHGGYFLMGTDLSNEYALPALAEMRHELERMRTEPVPADELEIARNFWLGRLAARAETSFEAAEILRAYIANGLTVADDEAAFRAVEAATAEDILRVAQTHFHPDALLEVVAGGGSEQ